MSGPLEGRVALVTGGGRGIGRAIAETLHRHGADPTIAREVTAALGPRTAAFTESIASPSAAATAEARAVEKFGGIDIVVNNAAILRDVFVVKADPLDWEALGPRHSRDRLSLPNDRD